MSTSQRKTAHRLPLRAAFTIAITIAVAALAAAVEYPSAGASADGPAASALGSLPSRILASGLSTATLIPFSQKREGRIGAYRLGNWPHETTAPRSAAYAPPAGFIEVTLQNRQTRISEHFTLGDFLDKDQATRWPKYLALDPQLVEKLELVIEELAAQGHRVDHVQVLSGFRTPNSNATGNTQGRSQVSRHMYGDASDVYIDSDRNGLMDDLNRDGRIDLRDAEVVARAAERVEARHPELVGGVGTYATCCGHGPFVHIDSRGSRARWSSAGAGL